MVHKIVYSIELGFNQSINHSIRVDSYLTFKRVSLGFDLSSAYDMIVPKRNKAIAKTDLAISIPYGTYARVAPRSGLAAKNFIDVGAGVVDYDYR